MRIMSKKFWDLVFCKTVETLISVKLWILALTSFTCFRILDLNSEIKDYIFLINESNIELSKLLVTWSSKLMDINLAMFTGVIVVVTLSREVFKHAMLKDYDIDEKPMV